MLHFRGNTCKPNQTSKCSSRWCSPQKGLQAPEGTIEFGASTTNLQISRHLHLHEANCPQPDIVSGKLSHLFVFSAFLRALKSWWFPGTFGSWAIYTLFFVLNQASVACGDRFAVEPSTLHFLVVLWRKIGEMLDVFFWLWKLKSAPFAHSRCHPTGREMGSAPSIFNLVVYKQQSSLGGTSLHCHVSWRQEANPVKSQRPFSHDFPMVHQEVSLAAILFLRLLERSLTPRRARRGWNRGT